MQRSSSALPKGLSQPLWSPRGLVGPPGQLMSLGSPPRLLEARGNKDPPEKRMEVKYNTLAHGITPGVPWESPPSSHG